MSQIRIFCASSTGGHDSGPHLASDSKIGTEATISATPLSGGGAAQTGPDPDLTGLVLKETYRIVRKIGSGGMGLVYQAMQDSLNRSVAVKVLGAGLAAHTTVVERFLREARVLARLSHPNIVQVFDCGAIATGPLAGHPYIVMEYVESGVTLLDLIGRYPTGIPTELALPLAIQVLEALAEAHDHGIIHRDLKPENVLLIEKFEDGAPRLIAKVCDYGVAKEQSGAPSSTQGYSPLGTPDYMSPEQVRGTSELDSRADLYAFGVMFYEMLTGRNPYGDGSTLSPVERMSHHLYREPTPIPVHREDIPPGLVKAIFKAMSKDPSARPGTARELIHEIRLGTATSFASKPTFTQHPDAEPVLLNRPKTPVPEAGGQPPPPDRKRRSIVGILAAVLVAIGLAFGIGLYVVGPLTDHAPSPQTSASPPRQRVEVPPAPAKTLTKASSPTPASTAAADYAKLYRIRKPCFDGVMDGRVTASDRTACANYLAVAPANDPYRMIIEKALRTRVRHRVRRAAPMASPTPSETAPEPEPESDEPAPEPPE